MEPSRAYQPDALDRMTIVLERAAKELNLAGLPASEKERLAACILSVGNTYTDTNRLLEKSVRLYLRARTASSTQNRQPVEATVFF
ncbi:MAG: hypothetical protein JSR78_00850 [Proteobacteria bacterium]|nr:hypothetical protein [Pseudomonadota bacterium]